MVAIAFQLRSWGINGGHIQRHQALQGVTVATAGDKTTQVSSVTLQACTSQVDVLFPDTVT